MDALSAALPPSRIVFDSDVMTAYARDQAAWVPAGRPVALVKSEDAEQVRAVVAACAAHGVPIVPRGSGTGLSGGANAVDGCVLPAMDGMDRILEIDPAEQLAVVQPGVVNDHLRAAAGPGVRLGLGHQRLR